MIAVFDPVTGITVWGSLQCPFYVHKALRVLCGLPEDKIRVVQMETGGAFGGKEEYPSMIAGHAALLAMKSGRPVKIIRSEEHTSELQSLTNLVCRLLLEKKKKVRRRSTDDCS